MGEMKVEHVLLFLVGAFLVYHMMGKCRRVEGYDDCDSIYDYTYNLGCDNRASRCAGWEEAKHFISSKDRWKCYDDRCKNEGTQWSVKENGDEYYYYPDQRRCRSYVDGRWNVG